MLRLYAIRLQPNLYIVVHGGIKLTKKIKDTPTLKKEVFHKIDEAIGYLRRNGIVDLTDI